MLKRSAIYISPTPPQANNPRISLPHSLDHEDVSLNDSVEENSDAQSHASSVSQEAEFSKTSSRRDDRRDRLQPSSLKKRKSHKHK